MYIPHSLYEMLPYLYMLLGGIVLLSAPADFAQICGAVLAYLGYSIRKMRVNNRRLALDSYYFEYDWKLGAE